MKKSIKDRFSFLAGFWRRQNTNRVSAMQEVFTGIYRENSWGDAESRSGPGSSLQRTARLRGELPGLIHHIAARSILDIPCGDFNWMRAVGLDVDKYIGADIVQELISENRRKYAARGREFRLLDITADRLPEVDLILCRDCLFHFSYSDIFLALNNIKRSRSSYLLATTFINRAQNQDTATGGWRPLNMQQSPFFFPSPLSVIIENPTSQYPDKSLALWRINDL